MIKVRAREIYKAWEDKTVGISGRKKRGRTEEGKRKKSVENMEKSEKRKRDGRCAEKKQMHMRKERVVRKGNRRENV